MTDKRQKWFAVRVEAASGTETAVEFVFNELDSLGNEIDLLGHRDPEHLDVVGYFDELPDIELIKRKLSGALQIYGFPAGSIRSVGVEEIENRDWLAEWKKHWKPTETEKFVVAPPWENLEKNNKFIIRIEPNMAFGTGTHETTRLCLRAIESLFEPEMSFLDVGTGTGILAIAAARIQGGKGQKAKIGIAACDTDEEAVIIARENAELNETEEIGFFTGSVTENTPEFDFVCANLTAGVIIPLLPLLLAKSKKILVLSGILIEQKSQILAELQNLGINNAEVRTDGEWTSVKVIRER